MQRKLAAMTPEERAAREARIREHKLAREAKHRQWLISYSRECSEWERLKAECKRAWDERRSTVVDYAVMRVDFGYGFRRVDEMAKTPEEFQEIRRHCGWPNLPFKQLMLRGGNWRIACVSRPKEGMQYVMYISEVGGHNREKRERFFDAVRQIYDFRSHTPQWNGARARELYLFPKVIPDDCSCRWCKLAQENQPGSR